MIGDASTMSPSAQYEVQVSPVPKSTRPTNVSATTKDWHTPSGKFRNPWPSYREYSTWWILKATVIRQLKGQKHKPSRGPPTVPVINPEFLTTRFNSSLRATWLGHACSLVEFPSGIRVLFDPVFEEVCSPLKWAGPFASLAPKRITSAPCRVEDIPFIDAVVISHNHYDHLSSETITKIASLHPQAYFFVPLGNKAWFNKIGIKCCTELDWWDEVDLTLFELGSSRKECLEVDGSPITARIGCLPSQHDTARGLTDRFSTLWASWSVVSGGKSVWFGGDTGYRSVPLDPDGNDEWCQKQERLPHCPAFAEIGTLQGPFDLGLIPIGAYRPRYITAATHASPHDAVEIFRDTHCYRAIGIHWGTWILTEEEVVEPPILLKEALAYHNIDSEGVFDTVKIGESRTYRSSDGNT
jgi:N-acyl-phosphatidylethanolamine-hydrolysing phospholipase D